MLDPICQTTPLPNPLKPAAGDASPTPASSDAGKLLKQLLQQPWQRLQPDFDDPIGFLFYEKGCQWTLGWGPDQALYLLIWQLNGWQQPPYWRLYQNGRLILKEAHGQHKQRSAQLNTLLESPQLPFINPETFCTNLLQANPGMLTSFHKTLMTHPVALHGLKHPLFQLLESPSRTVQEMVSKRQLLTLIQQLARFELLRHSQDLARLRRLGSRIHCI